jgi:hypothetical protein
VNSFCNPANTSWENNCCRFFYSGRFFGQTLVGLEEQKF